MGNQTFVQLSHIVRSSFVKTNASKSLLYKSVVSNGVCFYRVHVFNFLNARSRLVLLYLVCRNSSFDF